jgi:hypothetical protein
MENYEFHPLAEEYPMMPDDELEQLVADMKQNGYDHRWPIIIYDGKILDGRNRYKAARKAKVEPVFKRLGVEDDPVRFVKRANEHRRHLSKEWTDKKRQERVSQVAALRGEGKSIRSIADEVKVSPGQVQRDLKNAPENPSGVSQDTPDTSSTADATSPPSVTANVKKKGSGKAGTNGQAEVTVSAPTPEPAAPAVPEKVQGKDGRTYQSTRKGKKRGPRTKPTVKQAKKSFQKNMDAMIRDLDDLECYAHCRPLCNQIKKIVEKVK